MRKAIFAMAFMSLVGVPLYSVDPVPNDKIRVETTQTPVKDSGFRGGCVRDQDNIRAVEVKDTKTQAVKVNTDNDDSDDDDDNMDSE